MEMNNSTVNKDISIARESPKNISDPSCKNGVMDQGQYIKWSSQLKWTTNEYHAQDKEYVSHT